MSDCTHEWRTDEHDHITCLKCFLSPGDVESASLRDEVERLRADGEAREALLFGVMEAVRRFDPNAGVASCTERDHVDRIVDEVERLRTRETKAVVALTSIKNQLTKGPVEFAGWSVVAERARREAESALAEWEKP